MLNTGHAYGSITDAMEVLKKKRKKSNHWSESASELTDRETAACQRSDCQLLQIEGAKWSA
jgi:hypothetical protein